MNFTLTISIKKGEKIFLLEDGQDISLFKRVHRLASEVNARESLLALLTSYYHPY